MHHLHPGALYAGTTFQDVIPIKLRNGECPLRPRDFFTQEEPILEDVVRVGRHAEWDSREAGDDVRGGPGIVDKMRVQVLNLPPLQDAREVNRHPLRFKKGGGII